MITIRIRCLIVISLFMGGVCYGETNSGRMQESSKAFEEEIHAYQSLIEEALVWRIKAISFIEELKNSKVYNSDQLAMIHRKGTNDYRRVRERLLAITEKYKWITETDTVVKLTDGKSRIIEQGNWWDPFDSSRKVIEVNPEESIGQLHIKKAKLSLTSALILYDNYLVAIDHFQKIGKIRRLINSDNVEVDGYLDVVSNSFIDLDNYMRTAKAIRLIDKELAWELKHPHAVLSKDKDNLYLNHLMLNSFSYSKIDEISSFDIHKTKIRIFANKIHDIILDLSRDVENEVSNVFGNAVGLIASRRGKLDVLPQNEQLQISSTLEPLDILLEKTPFRLTDKLIPGHWGHVALWVGTEEELKDLGVWHELPALYRNAVAHYDYRGQDFQQMIRSGHHVIEALRSGVEINTLDAFLNIDDLAVLRHHDIDREQKREYLMRAFEQLGKEYDFNFDVETDKEIVCSELAYVVYRGSQFNWPTDKTMGRYTISPDHIASKAASHNLFYPVLLYHDGKQITQNIETNFKHLLQQEYHRLGL